MARDRIAFQGLPARICWVGLGDRHRLGLAFNAMVAKGELKAPLVIGRDHLDSGSVASPNRETEAMKDGSDAVSDWPLLNALLNCASGATWVSLHHGGGVGMGFSQHSGMVVCVDGTPEAAKRIERVLWNDPATGVMRHADAGYDIALDCAREKGLRLPAFSATDVVAKSSIQCRLAGYSAVLGAAAVKRPRDRTSARSCPMAKMIFVNLPVKDLAASIRFYEAIGCTKNAQFSDDNAASMVWSDEIIFMLLRHEFYSTFTKKAIADTHAQSAVLIALSRDSRAEVDAITEAAAAAGGKADPRPAQDMGFMYGRAFEDLDGHTFEPVWMDMSAAAPQ